MAAAVSIQGLTKTYLDVWTKSEIRAVDNLSLEVEEGEVFGFLGRNGAGKTTTIKMLLGLIFPTAGTATILGKPIGDIDVKARISYLPEEAYFYDGMTGWDMLDFYARLFRIKEPERSRRIQKALEDVFLDPRAWRRPLRGYSKGMRQRIGIAQALINDPEVLFLDEPTSGLDPIAHAELREIIVNVGRRGKTVFLSSHQLPDVELTCTKVAIIHQGRLLTTGGTDELTSGDEVEITFEGGDPDLPQRVKAAAGACEAKNGAMRVPSVDPKDVNAIVDLIRSAKGSVRSIVPHRRSLEEVFVETVLKEGGN